MADRVIYLSDGLSARVHANARKKAPQEVSW
jgi:hypothetical protein